MQNKYTLPPDIELDLLDVGKINIGDTPIAQGLVTQDFIDNAVLRAVDNEAVDSEPALFQSILTPTENLVAGSASATISIAQTKLGNAFDIGGQISGATIHAEHLGDGALNQANGLFSGVFAEKGDVGTVNGIFGANQITSGVTVEEVNGIAGANWTWSGAIITNMYGVRFSNADYGSTITNAVGARVEALSAGA